ncbi:MAG: mannose-1-phosphate guanylyltransferase/mannose-6-phosphate isomerase [Edafosvirus sp.]|uniref:Mannose-1-phosphate guanylyltransferase/mannose-6-phosphate isomerase n=1 Tax=Edafosvirus sp. TaxID=2487765 RepID=A0A3G4ZYN8_9VIRU|nr:MAG: mannose-1-phosphate guanylyltransferase/mannose-6-phosphate isomerase [Edafosvirus sp.]
MSQPIHLILCAGSGTRLFPLSTKYVPKQFLKLENDYSLLQNTVLRLSQYPELAITTMQKYLNILEEQLAELNLKCKYTVIVVPETYNTAYSICAVSLLFKERKIIAIPSDKIFIQDEFAKLMESASIILEKESNKVLLFGIKPTYPATGFGYLECKGNQVIKFIEKPSLEKATEYLANGTHYWNGGMLGFASEVMNKMYWAYRPDIIKLCDQATKNSIETENKNVKLITLAETLDPVEDISIDYAINEKLSTDQMSLITFSGKWSDVGSWNSVYDILEKDGSGINKSAKCKNYKSDNCLLMTKKPIYLNGVSNLVIVESDECILISGMDKSQDIKKLLSL